jgi:ferredoxin
MEKIHDWEVPMRKGLTVGSLIPGQNVPKASSDLATLPSQLTQPTQPLQHASKPAPIVAKGMNQKTVRVKQRDQEHLIRLIPGVTLLDAALSQKEDLAYKCQQGHCGKCTVQIISGVSLLGSPTEQEREKLGSKIAMGYRLACQTAFADSLQR